MALKGGRKIVVRGKTFFWIIRGESGRFGGAPQRPNVVIQEGGNSPGAAMVAYLESRRYISHDAHDLDMGGTTHRASVTPADISQLIGAALDLGWVPSGRSTFILPSGWVLSDYTTVEP